MLRSNKSNNADEKTTVKFHNVFLVIVAVGVADNISCEQKYAFI